MVGSPGQIYNALSGGHLAMIYDGAGSVLCQLTSNTGSLSQGVGAMLSTDDPSYDEDDQLRGLPSFTGVSYDPDTGLIVSADQAEIGIRQAAITVGRPQKGWTGKLRNMDGSDLDFYVEEVMQDRTLGVYRIRLKILKAAGAGRRINRAGEGGV